MFFLLFLSENEEKARFWAYKVATFQVKCLILNSIIVK